MKNLTRTSLSAPRSATTLRLKFLMDEQQRIEIGQRLKELRENSPQTNRSVGDAVGVTERTVAEWAAGRQGMTYDNAKKVAELFGVDLDWLWRGDKETPDVMKALSPNGRAVTADDLQALHTELRELRREVAAAEERVLRQMAEHRKALEDALNQQALPGRTAAPRRK